VSLIWRHKTLGEPGSRRAAQAVGRVCHPISGMLNIGMTALTWMSANVDELRTGGAPELQDWTRRVSALQPE